MIQIILLLIGITIGSTYPSGLEPDVYDPHVTLAAVPALCLLYGVLGVAIGRTYLRRFLQARDDPRGLFGSFLRCVGLYRVLLLAIYAFQVHALLWPSCVAYDLGLGGVILAEKLLVVAPLFLSLFLSWIPLYRLDRILKGSDWTLRSYVVFHTRLVIGPVLAIVAILHVVFDGAGSLPVVGRLLSRVPAIELVLLLGTLVVMSVLMPLLLRLVWGGRPIPPGTVRDRLLALCERAGIGVRDLLVWETFGGRFVNALVTGVAPRLRYVFFTRPLLDGLGPEELDAVLAHELGHARHRHLVWFFTFAAGLILVLFGAQQLWGASIGAGATMLFAFGPVVVFWGFIMLFASRRFEGQADLFSLSLVGDAAPLASALLKVAALSGIPPGARSVTHGSIEERVSFLAAAQRDPLAAARLDRTVAPVRGLILGMLGAGVLLTSLSLVVRGVVEPSNGALDRAQELYNEGVAAMASEKHDVAARLFREASVLVPKHYLPWLQIGNCEELRGDLARSRAAFAIALDLHRRLDPQQQDPWIRVALRKQIQDLDRKLMAEQTLGGNSK